MIAADGEQLGILPTDEARRRAEEQSLDLVEVSPMARPPVCKIMDFGKFKYDQKKKANEAKKKQHVIEVKEVKFRPKTDQHDFDVKLNRLKRFLEEGNKSKVTIMFRGREIVHPEIGRDILNRVADAVKETGQVETPPRMEGRQMFMIVGPARQKKGADGGDNKAAAPSPAPAARPAKSGPEITRAPQRPTTPASSKAPAGK